MKKSLTFIILTIASTSLFAIDLPGDEKAAPSVDEAAVQRSRETVQMLDGVYKNIIVLVTDKYVHDEDDFAAGSAAVELFKAVSKGDAQKVRLIDVTGEPYEPENVAKSEFEKQGVKQLKKGEAYYDEVFSKDGKPYLRAVTAVPVVHKKCIMCHSHYEDAKDGESIGALSYIVPVK